MAGGGEADACVVSGNSAAQGGGLYLYQSQATVDNCIISGNRAGVGGGLECDGINTVATWVWFIMYHDWGVWMYVPYYYPPSIVNCTISNNTATQGGGLLEYLW